jgi:hypothetical protein
VPLADHRPRRRRRLIFGGIVALLLIGGMTVAAAFRSGEIGERLIEPAAGPAAATPGIALDAHERAFYEYVAPRLSRLSAEATTLADLAASKSRNLLEIQTRGDRVNQASAEIDAYARQHGVPDRFQAGFDRYQRGAESVRAGMNQARSAFVSLDFDRIPQAVERFNVGVADLDDALLAMEAEAAQPTALPAATAG